MRNATILVMGLKGVATEAIKNIVLAGIGRLIMADGEDVSEEDLGAGFFFRDEDVGRKVGIVLVFFVVSNIPVSRNPWAGHAAQRTGPRGGVSLLWAHSSQVV